VSPQRRAKGLSPSLRLAEKVKETLLFSFVITPARCLDLNLAAQSDGVNRLVWFSVGDAQFERQERSRRVSDGFDSFYLKV